ncbi:MAG: 2-amino-4-hydroxy-6-hydroxymethyldihydropteridine diphosphokinase, partial [Deltaproteobacteria bacterium]|nr:2-amino-4-hydroxy-6-hydroxymethyldihydropteridine diphosphokinase [Deltaproteobacteria bacterium]
MPHVAYIGLGSNLGERRTFLLEATLAMAQLGQLQACSSVYQTPPWGDPFQPAYYNAAVCLHTELHPQALLTALLTIESAHGRKRNQERPCGPRTL